jgi:hypothetical protein
VNRVFGTPAQVAMKSRLRLSLVCLACLLGFVLVAWGASKLARRASKPSPISRAAFDQIKEGMTLEEVESVIGVPPGDYAPESGGTRVGPVTGAEPFWSQPTGTWFVFWSSRACEIIVSVAPDGRVTGKMFYRLVERPPPTVMERVDRWFQPNRVGR